jgi:cytochrome c heme-lyase
MTPDYPTGSTAKPPPECPMHASNAAASPYAPPPAELQPQPSSPSDRPAECPVQHGKSPLSGLGGGMTPTSDELNPLNNMPTLSHQKAPGQAMELPTERTTSTIPRPNAEEKVWEYPSPQQFYNALVRKGWETPEEHVETMVDIHNFLNEEAWQEVLKWESGQRG